MDTKKLFLRKENGGRIADALLRFLLTAVLFAARIFGGYVPFALGMIAAAGGGWNGVAALAGGVAGSLLFLDFPHALRALATGVLIFSANNALGETKWLRKPLSLPLLTAVLQLSVEFVYVSQEGLVSWAHCIVSLTLAALAVYWYRRALFGKEGERADGALALLISLVAAAASLTLPDGFSPGRCIAMLLVLLLSFDRSASVALTVALCIGLCMDFVGGTTTMIHAVAYGIGALVVSTQRHGRRVPAALLFALSVFPPALLVPMEDCLLLVGEALGAAVLFLLFPAAAFEGRRIATRQREDPQQAALSAVQERLEQASAAFRELYDSFSHPPHQPPENPSVIFDRVADQVCRNCALRSICWEREYGKTKTALNDATGILLKKGTCDGADFPSYFSDRCVRLSPFLSAVNRELSAYLLRRQYRDRLAQTRALSATPYAQASELLRAAADRAEASAPVNAPTAIAYQIGATLRPKRGQSRSGDSSATLETDDGKLCLLLADGMGSGEEARHESAMAVHLLERFLRSGVAPDAAMQTLNNAFSLRAETGGAFTTVDLLRLDLHSGEAEVYKYGAAPSYVKQGGRVRRINCSCLPAGLQDVSHAPECTRLRLEGGTFFVMLTDGVVDGADDEWLQNLLAGWDGDDPRQMVAAILADSAEHTQSADDAGVMVLYLPETSLHPTVEI